MSTGSEAPEVVWHDLECGAAATDLPVWEALAGGADGPILELGCGTGRVALHLARHGHEVLGVDSRAVLVDTLNQRASQEQFEVQALVGDVRRLDLKRTFGLVIAPLQLIQHVGEAADRLSVLRSAAAHLDRGGRAAFALVEEGAWHEERPQDETDPLPDVLEVDGWVFSSRPLGVAERGRGVVVERFRQRVDPEGAITEERHSDHLDVLDAARLEEEARPAGLIPVERLPIRPDPGHAESVAVVFEKR